YYLEYRGEVLLVNKDARAFFDLQTMLGLFAPRFSLSTLAKDLWREPIGRHAFVAANHVLDDLTVDHYGDAFGMSADDIYNKEGAVIEVWERIVAAREQHLLEMTARVVPVFEAALAPGGMLVVAQYESYIERVLDLERVTAFNVELLARVKKELVARG